MKKNKYLLLKIILSVFFVLFSIQSIQVFADEIETLKYKNLLTDKAVQEIMKRGPFLRINESVPGKIKPATAGIMINATPERIWKIMTNYENYDKIFLSVGNTNVLPQVLERSENRVTVCFKIEVADFPFIKLYINCVQKAVFEKSLNKMSVSWENAKVVICPKGLPRWLFVQMVPKAEGEIKDGSGVFEFIPIDQGKRTAVFCTATADFQDTVIGAKTLLGKFPEIEPMITLGGMRIILEALERAAEK